MKVILETDRLLLREYVKEDATDANTAILYVYSAGSSNGAADVATAFIFTLKFDAEGKCKIVKAQKASKEESED